MNKIIKFPSLKKPAEGSLQAIYMHRDPSEETKRHLLRFGFEEYENNVFVRKPPEMTHEQCQEAINNSSSPLVEVEEPIKISGIDELVEWLEE